MGFFKKLFEKKDCEICGGEIGLLGNRKLVDGDMCKSCAAKLSPWFEDRKESTVAQIKEQLAYREANAGELKNSFRPTKTLGEYYKMYVMYENGCPSKFVVSNDSDYVGENADIIKFSDVTSCNVDIEEEQNELKRENDDGEEVSYNPPRFEYRYDFCIEFGINSPYFDSISFRINRDTVEMITVVPTQNSAGTLKCIRDANKAFDPTHNLEFRKYQAMCDEILEIVKQGQQGIPTDMPVISDTSLRSVPASTPAASGTKVCPACNAEVTGKFCEYCGTKME